MVCRYGGRFFSDRAKREFSQSCELSRDFEMKVQAIYNETNSLYFFYSVLLPRQHLTLWGSPKIVRFLGIRSGFPADCIICGVISKRAISLKLLLQLRLSVVCDASAT